MKRINALLMTLILVSSISLTGCRSIVGAYVWLYENVGDIEVTQPDTKPNPPVVIEPNPEADVDKPLAGVDELPWDKIVWIGQANGSKAINNKALRSVTIKGDNVYIDWDGNEDWDAVHHSDWEAGVDCYGRMCCFVIRDGKIIGGHVDHMRKGCKQRDLNNVYGQYIFNPPVSSSEDLYFAFVSNDCKNRTRIIKGTRK